MSRRGRAAAALLLVLAAVAAGSLVLAARAEAEPDVGFTWAMPERFGAIDPIDGLVEYLAVDEKKAPTDEGPDPDPIVDATALRPASWDVQLDACDAGSVAGRTGLTFEWSLDGAPADPMYADQCAATLTAASLGSHVAQVIVFDGGTEVGRHSQAIELEDHLIVSIGDSVASGEGVADRLEPVAAVPPWSATWQEAPCHRSALAGPAQAARRLEQRDPHSSVTFVHLACSGAEMTAGLTQDYGGVKPVDGVVYKPQVEMLGAINALRPVDAVTVSIGANDLHFAEIVEVCLYTAHCHTASIPGKQNAQQLFDARIGDLDERYEMLDQAFTAQGISASKVHITEYFNPTYRTATELCDGHSDDERAANRDLDNAVVDGLSLDEFQWADTVMMAGLNGEVSKAAQAQGWNFVGGIAEMFKGHGYCARDRWVRTIFESLTYQGDAKGPFHPNADGHLLAYGTKIEESLAETFQITAPPVPIAADAANAAIGGAGDWLGLLDGLDVDEELTAFEPWGAVHDKTRQFIRWALSTSGAIQADIEYLGALPGKTLLRFDNALDDLDEDGDRARDYVTPEGVVIDIEGSIEPHLPSPTYEVVLKVRLTPPPGTTSIDLARFGLDGTQPVGAAQEVIFELPLRIDTGIGQEEAPAVRARTGGDRMVGRARASTELDIGATTADVGGDQPALATAIGLFEGTVSGTVEGMIEFGAPLVDPDADGYLTRAEWDAADAVDDVASLFGTPRCTAGTAEVALSAKSNVPGLTHLGTVSMADEDGCDGFSPPDIDLVDEEDVGVRDVVDAIHRLYRAIRTAHRANDPDLPLVDERSSDLADPSRPLQEFFRKEKLVDRTGEKLTYDPAAREDLDTLPELTEKLARHFRQRDHSLGLSFDPASRRLSFRLAGTWDPSKQTKSLEFDTAELMEDKGVVSATGTVSGSVDPWARLDLPLVIDLGAGELTGMDRVFLDTSGTEVQLDAVLAADVDVSAELGPAELSLTDSRSGPIPLLTRADPAAPMLAVDLSNGADPLLALASILEGAFQTDVSLRAQVPATKLVGTASAGTVQLARGECMIGWRDVTSPPSFTSACDGAFMENVRPLAGVHDPVAFLRTLLGAFSTAVQTLDGGLRGDGDLTEPLPIIGTAIGDVTPVLLQISEAIDDILATDVSTSLEELELAAEQQLGTALGVPPARRAGLIDVGYTPYAVSRTTRTGTRPAVTLTVDLGVCTTGRDSNNDGDRDGDGSSDDRCTFTVPAPSAPFSLDLGTSAITGLQTAGAATLDFDGSARLAFGIELPAVKVGADGGVAFDGSLRPYVDRSSRFELGVAGDARATFHATLGGITVSAGNRRDPVSACVRLRSAFAAPDGPPRVYPEGVGAFVDQLAAAGTGSLSETVGKYQQTCTYAGKGVPRPATQPSGEPQGAARVPVYATIGSSVEHLGTATLAAPRLLDPATWDLRDGGIPARLADVGRFKWRVLHEGLVQLLDTIEAQLVEPRTQQSVPLIGEDLDGGADIVRQLNDGLVRPLGEPGPDGSDSIVATMDKLAYTDTLESRFEQELDDLLGPTGADLLVHSGTTPAATDLRLLCATSGDLAPCPAGTPTEQVARAELVLPLGQSTTLSTSEPVDLGFPGLRLRIPEHPVDGGTNTMSTRVGWNLDLRVGIDRYEGFYVHTAATKDSAGNDQPELRIDARAFLPDVLQAEIAFIPLTLEDQDKGNTSPNPSTDPDASAQTDAWAGIGLDLIGGYENRLTVDRLLGSAGDGTEASVEVAVGACVGIQSRVVTKDTVGTNDTGMPSLSALLRIEGGYDCPAGRVAGAEGKQLSIVFEGVELDLGSWISDFLQPVATEVDKVLQPIRPGVEAIQQPIPGVAEAAQLAKLPAPTWLDAFKAYSALQGGTGGDTEGFLSRIAQALDLLVVVDGAVEQLAAGEAMRMPIGTFTIHVDEAGDVSATADDLLGGSTPSGAKLRQYLSDLADQTNRPAVKELATKLTTAESFFTFPAFEEPSQLFLLLLGKDPTLVQFNAGVAEAEALLELKYPIGPALVGIEGRASLDARFIVGFDTHGMREALKNMTDGDVSNDGIVETAAALLQGLYVEDKIGASDPPELVLDASIAAVASVGIPELSVDVVGGIHANVTVDINAEGDRLRYPEAYAKIQATNDPLCLFNASGSLSADLRLRFTNPVETWEEVIASRTLIDTPNLLAYCKRTSVPPLDNPVGTVTGTTLTLKTQATKPNRIRLGSIKDGSVYGTTYVSGPFGTHKFPGYIEKVVVPGGSRDDDIVVLGRPSTDPDAPAPTAGFVDPRFLYLEVDGGGGHDRIEAAQEIFDLQVNGGSGNDVLTSNGPTVFDAGPGDDHVVIDCYCSGQLYGGDGNDDFSVAYHRPFRQTDGSGNETSGIRGGEGIDRVAYDFYDPLRHWDPEDLGLLTLDLSGSDPTAPVGFERITATPHDDTVIASSTSQEIDGGAGDDTLTGGEADDYLEGGPGDDTLEGRGGYDQLYGSDGNDTLTGGVGGDIVLGGNGDDSIDNLLGGAADREDHYSGGLGRDTIRYSATEGTSLAPGARVMLNGRAESGSADERDLLLSDFEEIHGSAAGGTILGSALAESIFTPVGFDTVVNAGGGDDRVRGGGTLSGGSGDDRLTADGPATLRGDGGDDVLVGSPGDDVLEGGSGNDSLDARGGDDRLSGKRAPVSFGDPWEVPMIDLESTDDDVLLGGAGADHLDGGPGADDIDPGSDPVVIGSGVEHSIDVVDLSRETKPLKVHFSGSDSGTTDDWSTARGRGDRYLGGQYVVVRAGSGDDDLAGPAEFWGGPGDDAINGWGSYDTRLVGGPGADVITGTGTASYEDRPTGAPVVVTIGTDADDGHDATDRSTDGTRLDDVQVPNVNGSPGADALLGDDRDNRLDGGEGYDAIGGGAGFDTISYASLARGVHLVMGATGSEDQLAGDIEQILGSEHADTMDASSSTVGVMFYGRDGDDSIIGSPYDDFLTGNDGDDVFDGGLGADHIVGGHGMNTIDSDTGTDVVDYSARTTPVYVDLDYCGCGYLEDHNGSFEPDPRGGRISLERDVIAEVEDAVGGAGDDILEGTSGPNTLHGGAGDDVLRAFGDEDVLHGGPGRDVHAGGMDVDEFIDAADDYTVVDFTDVFEHRSQGVVVDFVGLDGWGSDLEVLPPHTDEIIGSGGADQLTAPADRGVTLRGGLGEDTILGGPAPDIIDPGIDPADPSGVDTIDGRGGEDTLDLSTAGSGKYGVCLDLLPAARRAEEQATVQHAPDHFRTCADVDETYTRIDAQLQLQDVEIVRGTAQDDVILGTDGNDVLHGGGGRDYIDGRPGDDQQHGGPGDDVHFEGPAPNGADRFGSVDGADTVDYRARPMGSVSVTADGLADDGADGEGDNVPMGFHVRDAERVLTLVVEMDAPLEGGSARTDIPVRIVNVSDFDGTDVWVRVVLPRGTRLLEPLALMRTTRGLTDAPCRTDVGTDDVLCPVGVLGSGEAAEGTLSLDMPLGHQEIAVEAMPFRDGREFSSEAVATVDVRPSFTLEVQRGTALEANRLIARVGSSDPGVIEIPDGQLAVRVVGGTAQPHDPVTVRDFDDFSGGVDWSSDEAYLESDILGDGLVEGTETIEVLVEDPSGQYLPTTFNLAIDDENVPWITVTPLASEPRIGGREGDAKGEEASASFEICATNGHPGIVDFVPVGGTAADLRDFDVVEPVSLADGDCRIHEIVLLDDDHVEGTEFVVFQAVPRSGPANDVRFVVYIEDADDGAEVK